MSSNQAEKRSTTLNGFKPIIIGKKEQEQKNILYLNYFYCLRSKTCPASFRPQTINNQPEENGNDDELILQVTKKTKTISRASRSKSLSIMLRCLKEDILQNIYFLLNEKHESKYFFSAVSKGIKYVEKD
ncbi:hypothetical protein BpHYR1_041429 [Brachionus plicatilis]|uniref:Uncharacterized protein n=1 Tax=Brachionus plicatilis TaxID=10195 RepID=A0A3M7PVQ4_BRAPC|nr:hypothetical protein BpHYR1_041429 [Brachionus plicatilis]